MGNSFLFPSFLCFLATFLFFFISGGILKPVRGQAAGQGAWCIPKPSTSEEKLQENIDYACTYLDCHLIQPGGPCFEPNTRMNHASVLMNLYYQKQGRNFWNCDFKQSGVVAVTDPSYGSCKFQYGG